MASASESTKGGISITWSVVNFYSIENNWWTSCQLEWVKTSSKWKVEMNFTKNEGGAKLIRLVIEKLDKFEPISLSGTVSAVIETFDFELQKFEGHNFRKTKEKHIMLTPYKGIDFEKKGLISNGCLTLRLNLWDPEINDLVGAYYDIRSIFVQQKCSIPWEINAYKDWKRIMLNTEASIDIPMEFTDFSLTSGIKSFKLNFSLQVQNENMFIVLRLNDVKSKSIPFWIRGSYSIKIQSLERAEPFLDYKCNPFEFLSFKYYRQFLTDETWYKLVSRWIVQIDIAIATDFKGIIERISDEPNLQNSLKREDNRMAEKMTPQRSSDSLQQSLHTLYKEGKFCDVILSTGSRKLLCHRNVLCARSPVLRAMFEKNVSGIKNNTVKIDDVDPQILEVFVNYLYLGIMEDENFDTAINLYAVAKKYAVLNLRDVCAARIVTSLTPDNACEALNLSENNRDNDLKDKIITFFCGHAKEIMNSSGWQRLLLIKPFLAAKTAQAVLTRQK